MECLSIAALVFVLITCLVLRVLRVLPLLCVLLTSGLFFFSFLLSDYCLKMNECFGVKPLGQRKWHLSKRLLVHDLS